MMIQYECLRCGEVWHRPEKQEMLVQCPGCRSHDYDTPRRADSIKVCPVCLEEFSGSANAHGKPAPCSDECRKKMIAARRRQAGVFI